MIIVVMLGSTYSGKTTHGKLLAEELGATYISSGDIARSMMDKATESNFSEGQLSPHDDAISEAIYEKMFLPPTTEYVILDGFPRAAHHLSLLNQWLSHHTKCAIYLDVSHALIGERVKNRLRDRFDTKDIVNKRHDVFLNTTYLEVVEPILQDDSWVKFQMVLNSEIDIVKLQYLLKDVLRDMVSPKTLYS